MKIICSKCQQEHDESDHPVWQQYYKKKDGSVSVYLIREPRCRDCRNRYFRKQFKKKLDLCMKIDVIKKQMMSAPSQDIKQALAMRGLELNRLLLTTF